jgi:hypothetical protein
MVKMNGKIIITISAFTALVLLFFIACSALDLPRPDIQPRLENASVKPELGNWTESFTYRVYCSFSKEVNITLEVYNLSLLDWRPAERGTYNKIGDGKWHITWKNIRICSDECAGTSRYRFKDPRIPFNLPTVEEEFKNATVYPASGHFNDSFSCIVWVNLSVRHDINLEVLDIARYIPGVGYKWKLVGNETYNPGDWQKLTFTWNDKNNIFENDCAGLASYRFYYSADGERHESEIFYGPELISYNETKIIERYYYGGGGGGGGGHVSKSRLEKMVKEILEEEQLEEWKRQIGRSDIPLSKPNITCNVTPEVGRWFKPFKYNATIKNPDRANISLGLFVYKPGSDMWGLVKYKPYRSNVLILKNTTKFYNDENVAYIEWDSIGIFDVNDVNKNSLDYQYFIWYYDGYNENEVFFTGPENVTENHEPNVNGSVNPESGTFLTPFKFEAYINDLDGDDEVYISLYAKDPSNKMVPIGEKTVIIKGGKGNITWTVPSDEYPEDIFTAENLGNKSFNSSFYFEYSDEGMEILGISKKTSKSIPGPFVKPANVTFINATVSPEIGKYSDAFTYKAEFYSSENNTIHATLRIYDPSNPSEWEPFDKNETGTGTIYITWSEVSPDVFGPDDFNKTGNYSIVWRDEKLYTKEKEEEGPWHGPHINDGIPVMGGVALPLALIIVVPLVIPSMLIVSSFFRKIKRRY